MSVIGFRATSYPFIYLPTFSPRELKLQSEFIVVTDWMGKCKLTTIQSLPWRPWFIFDMQGWFYQIFNWFQLYSSENCFTNINILLDTVSTCQKWPFWKGVQMVSAIFHWFQLFYFLTRIIPGYELYIICYDIQGGGAHA